MIPRTIPTWQSKTWQDELSDLITQPEELLTLLNLNPALLADAKRAASLFPLRVTRSYVARMAKSDPADPLLRQVLPLAEELVSTPNYSTDPLGESHFNPVPGLIHKYHGRVLLITTPQCAINCRYCFRRHFDYSANAPSRVQWQQALKYIDADSQLEEVILSGGDPLVASDKQLTWLVDQLSRIEHVKRLRIHTRLPIVLPARITQKLITALQQPTLQTVMVIHANHAQEIDNQVNTALAMLKQGGITTLNQSVLLKGVNDSANKLAILSKVLFQQGVLPYYLHLLDTVEGAAGFAVDLGRAKAIYSELLTMLPGYLVPKLVREEPGAKSKTPVI